MSSCAASVLMFENEQESASNTMNVNALKLIILQDYNRNHEQLPLLSTGNHIFIMKGNAYFYGICLIYLLIQRSYSDQVQCGCINGGVCNSYQQKVFCDCTETFIGKYCQFRAQQASEELMNATITEEYSNFYVSFEKPNYYFVQPMFCPVEFNSSDVFYVYFSFEKADGSIEQIPEENAILRFQGQKGKCMQVYSPLLIKNKKANGQLARIIIRIKLNKSNLLIAAVPLPGKMHLNKEVASLKSPISIIEQTGQVHQIMSANLINNSVKAELNSVKAQSNSVKAQSNSVKAQSNRSAQGKENEIYKAELRTQIKSGDQPKAREHEAILLVGCTTLGMISLDLQLELLLFVGLASVIISMVVGLLIFRRFCFRNRRRVQIGVQPNNLDHFDLLMPSMRYEELLDRTSADRTSADRTSADRTTGTTSNARQDNPRSRELLPIKEEERMQEECSICLLPILPSEQIRKTPCLHVFHQECIDSWCINKLNCPTCRTEFKANPQPQNIQIGMNRYTDLFRMY